MNLTSENKLKNLIIVGDRVLIKPIKNNQKTDSGIFLPPGIIEKEKIQSGYIIKVGPGYPIPNLLESEDWQPNDEKIKYIPLQVKEGDLAIFLQKSAFELVYHKEKYFIAPQASILMLERTELFE